MLGDARSMNVKDNERWMTEMGAMAVLVITCILVRHIDVIPNGTDRFYSRGGPSWWDSNPVVHICSRSWVQQCVW